MQINPTPQLGLTNANTAQGVSFPTNSGGTSPGAAEGVRADWNVRMNVSHESGFVGGAGRMLVHNQVAEERTELVLFLPASHAPGPARLELASAVVCSAKPGIAAAPGQTLSYRTEGSRAIITIPILNMNDWLYIDLTWTGAFPSGGVNYVGGQVPLGAFHPQLAIESVGPDGTRGLSLVGARYEVEVGSDLGARVMLDGSDSDTQVHSRTSDDGKMTMHEFKSYGKAAIQARLAPPGAMTGSAGSGVTVPGHAGIAHAPVTSSSS
jgi:hypothetical protein